WPSGGAADTWPTCAPTTSVASRRKVIIDLVRIAALLSKSLLTVSRAQRDVQISQTQSLQRLTASKFYAKVCRQQKQPVPIHVASK
ncbi:MAG TPA: hypothetical protein VGQ77_04260, partial [Methylomirabilota bacterium]|nr:hypothetical protein [Methylomirabilota bacterium]